MSNKRQANQPTSSRGHVSPADGIRGTPAHPSALLQCSEGELPAVATATLRNSHPPHHAPLAAEGRPPMPSYFQADSMPRVHASFAAFAGLSDDHLLHAGGAPSRHPSVQHAHGSLKTCPPRSPGQYMQPLGERAGRGCVWSGGLTNAADGPRGGAHGSPAPQSCSNAPQPAHTRPQHHNQARLASRSPLLAAPGQGGTTPRSQGMTQGGMPHHDVPQPLPHGSARTASDTQIIYDTLASRAALPQPGTWASGSARSGPHPSIISLPQVSGALPPQSHGYGGGGDMNALHTLGSVHGSTGTNAASVIKCSGQTVTLELSTVQESFSRPVPVHWTVAGAALQVRQPICTALHQCLTARRLCRLHSFPAATVRQSAET